MQTPVTIVILAAGLGTRMKSRRAKVLHQAGGKTLI
jgi:bifunctional UDP-N-acetylglucosamine pyrophosphorylase / glucosamine-1-phosphate N-acetyltransferase